MRVSVKQHGTYVVFGLQDDWGYQHRVGFPPETAVSLAVEIIRIAALANEEAHRDDADEAAEAPDAACRFTLLETDDAEEGQRREEAAGRHLSLELDFLAEPAGTG